MALCKTSSYGEYASSLQYTNKQEQMNLKKTVAFISRQERQITSSVVIDQMITTKRLKAKLERSAMIEEKMSRIRGGNADPNLGNGTPAVGEVKVAWEDAKLKGRNQREILSPSIALPVALRILKSQGTKVSPNVETKIMNLDKNKRFAKRFSISTSRPVKTAKEVSDCPVPNAGNKHRRGSGVSSSSSGGLLKKKRPRNHVIPQVPRALSPLLPVRPSSAPRDHTTDKEFATAMWVAETTGGKERNSGHERPASAKPNIFQQTEQPSTPTDEESQTPDTPGPSEPPPVIDRFPTPPDSPDLSDLPIYEESLTAKSVEDLLDKLNQDDPEISLVDLHRAAVSSKNYPGKIRQFVRKIYRYKVAGQDTDYYSSRLHSNNKAST